MTDLRKAAQQATPRADLLAELMDSNEPKTEREHAAVYEIERLRAALAPQQVPNRALLEKTLAAMEGVIDVADRKTDEFEALRSCVIDLTLLLHVVPEPSASNTIANAMDFVIAAMKADPDYAWSWHCNVAMAFFDAGGDVYTANQGAARFMRLLAGVEPAHDLPAAPQPAPQPTGDVSWALTLELLKRERDDLLGVLKEVAEIFGEDWREGSTQRRLGDRARAAIAKAEAK